MTWANDSRTLFFGELDDTHRPHRLYRHRLGEANAELVFEEADGRFFLGCHRASSERQLVLMLGSKTTSESWVLTPTPRRRLPLPGPARGRPRVLRRPRPGGRPVVLADPQQPDRHQLRPYQTPRRHPSAPIGAS